MSVSNKLKWKRSLSRLRFCYDELEYTRESSKAAGAEFETYYRKYCAENNIDISELDQKNRQRLDDLYGRDNIAADNAEQEANINTQGDTSIVPHDGSPNNRSPEQEMTADDIAMHESFSKLFKQIALKLHPDRIDKALSKEERELRINMFQEANQAFEDKKYYFLLDLADKYSVSIPKNYELQTRWMKRESQRIVGIVDKEKNTYNFSFSQAETEEEKQQLIKKFIYQVFRVIT
tara:strand:+ start:225 stop:929 length:705 start_codon:yes stop_codon:yes gene_type:complete